MLFTVIWTELAKNKIIIVVLGKSKNVYFHQGADFKNNKTTKQKSHQEYYCFLEQFYLGQ